MLTANEVPFLAPRRELVEWCARHIDPALALPWGGDPLYPGFGTAGLTFPAAAQRPHPLVVNRFHWPTGAFLSPSGRPAFARVTLFASADAVNALVASKNAAGEKPFGADGNGLHTVDFYMDSPGSRTEETIETALYLLPPRPLSGVLPSGGIPETVPGDGEKKNYDTNNLYLVTLVDERYYWRNVSVGDLDVDIDAGTDWDSLIDTVAGVLTAKFGFTFDHDPVDSRYLKASPFFTLPYESAPQVLDAIAWNVGMRVVRRYDGSVTMQAFDTATSVSEADFAANPKRELVAGGSLFLAGSYF